jgi:hypothetical protein
MRKVQIDVKLIVTKIKELKRHYLNTQQTHLGVHLAAEKSNISQRLKD